MERLYRTVVQIEVAKETIQRGDLAHLRVALILLDNAVEVMMHRVIKDELFHAEWYERMLRTFPTGPLDPKGEELRTDMASHVISRRRREEIRRYFGAKVDFLSDRDRIPRPSARALKHLHNYRNETQHEDLVREESIRAVVMLLFDMTTNFLLRLKTGSTSWRGGAKAGRSRPTCPQGRPRSLTGSRCGGRSRSPKAGTCGSWTSRSAPRP